MKAKNTSRLVAIWTNAAGRVTGQAWEKVDYRDDPHLKMPIQTGDVWTPVL